MVHDVKRVETIEDETGEAETPAAEPRAASKAGRALLFAGVAGACALGAGLGLWARPSDLEHPAAAAKPAQAAVLTASARRIPIVIDDTPPPVGKPMDVLAASPPRPAVAPPIRQPAPAPEMMAPTRAPNGLVRVAAAVPGPIVSARPHTLLPPERPPVVAAPKPDARAAAAKLIQAQIEKTRAAEAKQARADEAKQARAEKLAEAREAKAEHAREVAERAADARAEAKATRLAKLKARHEKAEHAREVALAKAAPPPPKPHGLRALLAKLTPHHAKPEADAPAKLAKADGKSAQVRLASSTAVRCASPDPGEALACGDPNLSAAERRLARAYRDAEAAGVPAATLATQQTRWKAARAAAAREAPWAVREVYQARIAELQDLARDAQGN